MLIVDYEPEFLKRLEKIKNLGLKEKIKKQTRKIINSPKTGKPMKYSRKGTREVYIKPFRLSYSYSKQENKILFLELYHKDEQ